MKVALSWLKKYLEADVSLEEILEALTAIGLEVEEVRHESERLKDFIVADLVKAAPHPDANRLRVCEVFTGTETLSIVCGGSNARSNIKVALARVGTIIPASQTILKAGKIRGIESMGMLCSSSELLVDYPCPDGGILELSTQLPAGSSLAEVLGLNDPVIDLAIAPNRGDCFSVLGVARDLAAYFSYHGKKVSFKAPQMDAPKGSFKNPMTVTNKAPDACYAFHTALIQDIQNGESASSLQAQLLSAGLRPISAVVDVTNFMCLGMGRPLHVFDADKIQGSLTLRYSKKGESFEGLDDKIYTLDDDFLVICDEEGIISLAGVMGGKRTACVSETRNILLESAWFNPVVIAKAGQSLNILSDARMRFERGVDPEFVIPGLHIAVSMIQDICGGEISAPSYHEVLKHEPSVISLSQKKIFKVTGEEIPLFECAEILKNLGCSVQKTNDETLSVQGPSWRHDLSEDVDLIEEIVRIRGVDRICPTPLPYAPIQNSLVDPARVAARILTACGYHEAVTFSFVDAKTASLFKGNDDLILLKNPMTEDLTTMRPSILSGLLSITKTNQNRGQQRISFFETAPIYGKAFPQNQRGSTAALWCGKMHMPHWQCPKGEDVSAYDAKAHILQLFEAFQLKDTSLQFESEAPSYYHPTRSGTFKQGPRVMGYFGEIHPSILKHFGVTGRACGFEVFMENLPPLKFKARGEKAFSPYQAVERDFAFTIPFDFEGGEILTLLKTKLTRQSSFPKQVDIENVHLFDVYYPKENSKEKAMKSVAIRLRFQPQERTLADTDLDALSHLVITLIEKETGGKLRQ